MSPVKKAAIVVGYCPESNTLIDLLISLVDQVDILVFADNGGCEANLLNSISLLGIRYVDMQGNKGVGAALNRGFAIAVSEGAQYVATFDQDSQASPDLIKSLAAAMTNALVSDEKCIAVAPTFFDRRDGKKTSFPFYQTNKKRITPVFDSTREDGLIAVDVLITSGMFIRADAWSDGLKYDEALFVDFTDSEWCFRALSQGYHLYGCANVKMGHALSDAPPIKLFGLNFYRYSPLRRYFYFRNTVAVSLEKYTPMNWKRRLLLGLVVRFFANLIVDRERFQSLCMMIRGLRHGLTRRLGGM